MRRAAAATAVLATTGALLAPAASAAAAPPQPVDDTESFAAGDACSDSPIEVRTVGKSGFIDLEGRNPQFSGIATSPGLRITVTNTETGESVTVNATGAFRFVDRPDGETEIVAGGKNFLYAVPEVGATALATTGPIRVLVAEAGGIAAMDLSGAQVRDLCAEID